MKNKIYITTTIPYVNASPHIGFALEIVQADTLARFYRQTGNEVIFNTGTDEHGLKIYEKALEEKIDPQSYTDQSSKKFQALKTVLNLSWTNFIRTTEEHHKQAAQEFWKRCYDNGDIYKKIYKMNYCVGCEMEKTDSELVDGTCPLHPTKKLLIVEEENYFFKFSNYQNKLLELYKENNKIVLPEFRLKEIESFVKSGLADFSISRLRKKLPWGVPVPNDPDHVMYVWFDALVNYISTLGWPENIENFENYWPGIQLAGKDNLRQQSAIWQAMLLSAKLPTTKQILVHGFITTNGNKMSKSLGNVVDPFYLVQKYGIDAVRYYLLREIPTFGDGDYSESRMKELYNSDLANELGNLISRITNIAEKDKIEVERKNEIEYEKELIDLFKNYELNLALEKIWEKIKHLNKKIDEFAPWQKNSAERKEFLIDLLKELNYIGQCLLPFMPGTAEKIISSTQGKIKKSAPLFPKLEK